MEISIERVLSRDVDPDSPIHLLVGLDANRAVTVLGLALTSDDGQRAIVRMSAKEIEMVREILDPQLLRGRG